jgi:hypothetical protein
MRVVNPAIRQPSAFDQVRDFNVGRSIPINVITYRVYVCDRFTDEYFQSNGIPLNPFEEPPDDLYTVKRQLTDRPMRVTTIDTDKTNLLRFLDFDGQVLRFYCIWDDRRSLFGERRKFILDFSLVDRSIEIRLSIP